MSRRIEVELTSDRGDGTLTWRAAGAKEPRGVLDAGLLPDGVGVGDTVKAEADYDMEGVTIVAVLPPPPSRKEPERIEIIGSPPPPPRDYAKESERRDRKPRKGDRRKGREGRDRRGGERPDRPRFERPAKPKLPPKPKAPRLRAGRTHRQALLDSLPEEQRPVAEQVLKGGIPAVRDAIAEQNAAAKAAGQPPVKADALIALAENLVPRARVAEWKDRAEAAIDQIDVVDLRDLRSVVTKAESAARDEPSRELAEKLREGLAARLEKEQAAWLAEIVELLDDDRVVRALNLSSRPPKAGTPLPRDLADRLAAAAGAALTDQIGPKRWSTVLEALALSPVHAQVEPASIPASPSDELLEAVKRVSMQVPQIAAKFGIEPTPAPRRGPRSGRPRRSAEGKAKAPKIPPPPPKDQTPVAPAAKGKEAPEEEAPKEGAAAPESDEAPRESAPGVESATPAGDASGESEAASKVEGAAAPESTAPASEGTGPAETAQAEGSAETESASAASEEPGPAEASAPPKEENGVAEADPVAPASQDTGQTEPVDGPPADVEADEASASTAEPTSTQ